MPGHDLSRPRILVVEGNDLLVDAICDLVRDCGCDVAGTVGDVDHGVKLLADRIVDGAVVDIDLHGNFSLCGELQRRNVPFFFLSGRSTGPIVPPEFRQAKFLSRPLDIRQLKSALADFGAAGSLAEKPRPSWGNTLLASLAAQDLGALAPKLEMIALHQGQHVESSGQPTSHVHFPTGGLISIVASCRQGRRVEIGLVGSEGATGMAALLEPTGTSVIDSVVLLAGEAWRVSTEELILLLQDHRNLHAHLLRHMHGFIAQIAETALATGHATIEQRLARWLLMAAGRCGKTKLAVTHEHLARALAVRRSGITVALHALESRRLIRSQRKLIEVLDHAGLVNEVGSLHGSWRGSAGSRSAPVGLRDQEDQAAG